MQTELCFISRMEPVLGNEFSIFRTDAFLKSKNYPLIAALICLALTLFLPQQAEANLNLIQDGTFTSITYSGTATLSGTLFGQFGSDSTPGLASKSTLTVANWDTSGYNFVYAPGTADSGTNTGGRLNNTYPNEAPGQYNTAAGYGDTYMYGPLNGGTTTMPGGVGTVAAIPGGGNFVAMDGVYEAGPVTQTIKTLTAGQTYVLWFYWAGAQQQSFTGPTTEWLTVNMGGTFTSVGGTSGYFTGGQTLTTGTDSVDSTSFSGWKQQAFLFTATSGTETLSFLAGGTPSGQPPFTLFGDVELEIVPDFSNWMVYAGFVAVCILFEIQRRGRRQSGIAPDAISQTSGSY